jgi:cell division septation protein DedD
MRFVKWWYYGLVFAVGLVIASVLTRHIPPATPPRQYVAAETSLRGATSRPVNSLPAPRPFVARRDAFESGATQYSINRHAVASPSPGRAQRSPVPAQASRPSTASDAKRPGTPAQAVSVRNASGTAAPREYPTPGPSAGPDPAENPAEPTTAAPDDAPPTSFYLVPAAGTAAPSGDSQQTVWQTPRFHVQVAVFDKPEDAEALVQRLRALGYVATVAQHDGYQVWVGGYFDRETAESLAANLRKAGFNVTLVP